jgi:hypothetical protein
LIRLIRNEAGAFGQPPLLSAKESLGRWRTRPTRVNTRFRNPLENWNILIAAMKELV